MGLPHAPASRRNAARATDGSPHVLPAATAPDRAMRAMRNGLSQSARAGVRGEPRRTTRKRHHSRRSRRCTTRSRPRTALRSRASPMSPGIPDADSKSAATPAGFLAAARKAGWQFEGSTSTNRRTSSRASLGFPVNSGDLASFRTRTPYDAVAIWNYFDQLPDPRAAARAAHALLRPNGRTRDPCA